MISNSANIIFEHLDKEVFPTEVAAVYQLIKEYAHRVQFVKDHNGVHNVLFLSTADSAKSIFEFPYFSAYQFDRDIPPTIQNTVLEYAPEDIYTSTKNFLETTDSTLYVGIGFPECFVTNEDYFEILYLMEDTKCNVVDAFVSLRRFPEWYSEEAEFPFYILKEKEYLNQMQVVEKNYLLTLKQHYLLEMNRAVETNNEKLFTEVCEEIKNITNQIAEIS